jgi:acetaldehyde dehydrogenase (acetylating)
MQKPASRIIVNSPSSLGGVGYTTGLTPSMTLGCGTWGGSSLSDNLGPQHLINVKKIAYGIKKYENESKEDSNSCNFTADDIAGVVKQVLNQLQNR